MYSWRFRILSAAASFAFLAGFLATAALAQATIKVGHDQPEPSTHHQAALKWKELVEQRTGGKLKVQVFPSSQLGSGTQMVEQVQAGRARGRHPADRLGRAACAERAGARPAVPVPRAARSRTA